jgi:hypothetical protein
VITLRCSKTSQFNKVCMNNVGCKTHTHKGRRDLAANTQLNRIACCTKSHGPDILLPCCVGHEKRLLLQIATFRIGTDAMARNVPSARKFTQLNRSPAPFSLRGALGHS